MAKGDVAAAQVLGEFSIKPEAKQPQLDTSEVRSLISPSLMHSAHLYPNSGRCC